MKFFTTLLFCISIFLSNDLLAQFPGCPAITAGPDQCVFTPCTDIIADAFDVGETTSYAVESIPYNPPIAFGAAGGTPVSVGVDDIWSGAITLPFTFCYYGQQYTQAVIGSNGAITFNIANANGFQPWAFTASCPSAALVASGDIFGPYHGIDPSVFGSGTVQYYILGTAPCRIFVVTWDNIPMFSCNNMSSSHMIVLYETTNAIDVYVQDREVCTGWNSGNAVIGVQNPTGTLGIAAPGRNTGPWGVTTPEGWRFNPDGAPIYVVEWYEGATLIGTGDTVNVCPTAQTTYTAQVTYTACDGSTIVETDDVVLTPSVPLNLNVTQLINVSCNGGSDGEITVSATGGVPPFSFTINGGASQPQTNFPGLPAGFYTIEVTDNAGCTQTLDTTITEPPGMTLTEVGTTNSTCGQSNGDLEISVSGGASPYNYSINSGTTTQGTGLFGGLGAGTYSVVVIDNNGCMDSIDVIVSADPFPVLSVFSVTDVTCNGDTDGEITLNTSGGISPYTYTINGGSSQSSNIFSNLPAGNYTFEVTDNNGCTSTINGIVNEPAAITINMGSDFSICVGTEVTINANAGGGTGTLSYSWNVGGTSSTVTETPGVTTTYTVTVTDGNGCTAQESLVVTVLPIPVASAIANPTTGFAPLVVLFDNTSANGATYIWDFGNGVTQTTSGTTTVTTTYQNPGDYVVTLTASNGICDNTWTTLIVVIPYDPVEYNIPNIFTPNGDNNNDIFEFDVKNAESVHFTILNRWGNVMYESEGPNPAWDGNTQAGSAAEDGTYFVKYEIIGLNGDQFTGHTFFQLMR